jgi:hypothetical protein
MESTTFDLTSAYARLRAVMAPDPSRWYYTGQWVDAGEYGESHCACGHEVRYEFIIACKDDERSLVIGSTCIEKNVPALIEQGYDVLAAELTEARLKLQRDLAGQRRDLKAEEELAGLHADFRKLRNWCFVRRDEWPEMYPDERRPPVLHWIEKLPEKTEELSVARHATAIRRLYVSMWLNAAQAVAVYWTPRPAPMPVPGTERLSLQLTKAIDRALGNEYARNHEGALFAAEARDGLDD